MGIGEPIGSSTSSHAEGKTTNDERSNGSSCSSGDDGTSGDARSDGHRYIAAKLSDVQGRLTHDVAATDHARSNACAVGSCDGLTCSRRKNGCSGVNIVGSEQAHAEDEKRIARDGWNSH
ncbi:hypothetical protein PMI14_02384 [Acidovorax sp. CF316]|nr:hypothetical protein PMI14_02384 [Acidovorax sp. CF316]